MYNPWDWMAQLYSKALGTHFTHLLRHAWATVGLFFLIPVTTRDSVLIFCINKN